jgi:hypothetical protein
MQDGLEELADEISCLEEVVHERQRTSARHVDANIGFAIAGDIDEKVLYRGPTSEKKELREWAIWMLGVLAEQRGRHTQAAREVNVEDLCCSSKMRPVRQVERGTAIRWDSDGFFNRLGQRADHHFESSTE